MLLGPARQDILLVEYYWEILSDQTRGLDLQFQLYCLLLCQIY